MWNALKSSSVTRTTTTSTCQPQRRAQYNKRQTHGDRPLHATRCPCLPAGSVINAPRGPAGGMASQSASQLGRRVHSGRRSTWVESGELQHVDVSGSRPASGVPERATSLVVRGRCTSLPACCSTDPAIECRSLCACRTPSSCVCVRPAVRARSAASKHC